MFLHVWLLEIVAYRCVWVCASDATCSTGLAGVCTARLAFGDSGLQVRLGLRVCASVLYVLVLCMFLIMSVLQKIFFFGYKKV